MKIWLLLLFFLVPQMVIAESEIHTITLKHRLASDVLPQVEAFLPDNATVRAYDNMLILKSDRATLANVELLLKKLDKPQQAVIIKVMRSQEELQHQQGGSNQLHIEANDGINASVGINRWSTRDNSAQNQLYQARGIAGQAVTISLGEDIPQQQHLVFVGPRGVAVANDTQYISTANGFRAVPLLLPNGQVRVEIHPFFSKLSRVDGDIKHSDVITTVVGKVGEWLEIGRITENASLDNNGVTTYRSHGEQKQIIYLKIETAN